MPHEHCHEYARAGAGLPAIEPGMPTPAGTGLSRRSFLLRAAGTALAVYGGGSLTARQLQEGVAQAADGGPSRVLVNVFFSGGLDTIGVLGPYGSGRYADLRPTLHDPGARGAPRPFTADSSWFWHPDAAGFDRLHRAGRLVVLPSLGYDDANQSHFTSRHFWEIGSTDIAVRTGWMGRYLDRVGTSTNPVQGLTLGQSLVPSLAAAGMPVAAVEAPEAYIFRAPGVWEEEVEPLMHAALGELAGTPSGGDPVLAQAKFAQANASNLQSQLRTLPAVSGPTYPDVPFGSRLRTLAHMLDEELPIRCAGLIANGDFDTHAGQAAGWATHLPKAIASLEAFQADLEARGIADRVLTLIWSEFGRRPEQNGSGGTDHGAAAVGFVMGTKAAGRIAGTTEAVVGALPDISAAGLDPLGNLRHSIDYRDVYGSVLEQWLGTDAEPIVTGPGGRAVRTDLPLVRS